MLENIKSSYFIINIFSFIDDGLKLDIIKHNNKLQNIMNITIMNYKFFSGRYLINQDDKKVKEYYIITNQLAFEGEYLKGKRNGKGKEYYNSYDN